VIDVAAGSVAAGVINYEVLRDDAMMVLVHETVGGVLNAIDFHLDIAFTVRHLWRNYAPGNDVRRPALQLLNSPHSMRYPDHLTIVALALQIRSDR
jgi:hypothetical protein